MTRPEPKSFEDAAGLPEDVLYWAALFRATPEETEKAMEQVAGHPEPEPPPAR
ncbi:MAG TPA: hypothetical protein VFN88_04850 [Caulobacteraceae bacterium]|nr:hypothetical protein [Caulobacteraceae bacterium]